MLKQLIQRSNLKVHLIGLFLILFYSEATYSLGAFDIQELNQVTRQCFSKGRLEYCRSALIKVERVQRKAAANNDYHCQTHALGLGSHLIMRLLGENYRDFSLASLDKVNKLCQNIYEK